MLVIIGYIVVVTSVFGGYALAGGYLGAMLQPVELLIIGGAAVGAFIVGNSGKVIKATLLAGLNGYAPALAVEFARKVLYSAERPSFQELEEHVKQVKAR